MTQIDDALMEAGARAIAKHGYAGATMERIAREAGLSRVTLHRRGVGKADVLTALAERATSEYREAMWPALTGSGSASERLHAALEALCDVAERNLDLLLALQAAGDALFHEEGRGEVLTRSVFTEPLERLLRDGAADGSLRAHDDPVETATVLFNLVGWTYLHLRTGHRWPATRARAAMLDVALNGVAAPPRQRR